jgi:CHASE3 domain sensor protein
MQKLILGFLLGLSLHFLMGAYSSTAEQELSKMRNEMRQTNQHLNSIERSLDRIDDAFGSSGLRVKVER